MRFTAVGSLRNRWSTFLSTVIVKISSGALGRGCSSDGAGESGPGASSARPGWCGEPIAKPLGKRCAVGTWSCRRRRVGGKIIPPPTVTMDASEHTSVAHRRRCDGLNPRPSPPARTEVVRWQVDAKSQRSTGPALSDSAWLVPAEHGPRRSVSGRDTPAASKTRAQRDCRAGLGTQRGSRPVVRSARFSTTALACRSGLCFAGILTI